MIQSKSKIRLLLGWETEKVQQLCHDALHTANNRDFYILDRWWTVRGWGGWVSGGGGGTRDESNCQKEGQVLEDMNSDEEQ